MHLAVKPHKNGCLCPTCGRCRVTVQATVSTTAFIETYSWEADPAPVMEPLGAQSTLAEKILSFDVVASDRDGRVAVLCTTLAAHRRREYPPKAPTSSPCGQPTRFMCRRTLSSPSFRYLETVKFSQPLVLPCVTGSTKHSQLLSILSIGHCVCGYRCA